jgi:prepilin peptidase CpaA
MSNLVTVKFAVLLCLVGVAVCTDLRARRIPNWLTVTGVLAGLALACLEVGGFPSAAVLGVLLALAATFPLFALGALGAGDAKLLAAVAAFVGPAGLLSVILYGGVAGGGLAVVSTVRRGVILPVLFGIQSLIIYLLTLGRFGERSAIHMPGAHTVPYGVAIAAGAIAGWFFPIQLGGL